MRTRVFSFALCLMLNVNKMKKNWFAYMWICEHIENWQSSLNAVSWKSINKLKLLWSQIWNHIWLGPFLSESNKYPSLNLEWILWCHIIITLYYIEPYYPNYKSHINVRVSKGNGTSAAATKEKLLRKCVNW